MTSSGKLKADWLTEKWVVEIISKIMSLALGSRSTTASSWFAWFSACFFYFQLVMNAARRASLASGSSPWIDSLPYRARSILSEIYDDLKFLVTCQLDHWLPLPIPFAKLVQLLFFSCISSTFGLIFGSSLLDLMMIWLLLTVFWFVAFHLRNSSYVEDIVN